MKLIHFRRNFGRGGVGACSDGFADHVNHKFMRLFHVAQGVFALVGFSAADGAQGGTEQHRRRNGSYPVKKLKGARLAMPCESTVETRAMGRGTMMPVMSLYIWRDSQAAGSNVRMVRIEVLGSSMSLA